jgi:hypothetical protein
MPLFPPTPMTWKAGTAPQPADMNNEVHDDTTFLTLKTVFRAFDNVGTQTVPGTGTNTTLVLGTVQEDTYSGWTAGASNNYVAQVNGIYLAIVTFTFTGGSGAGHTCYASVNYKNGTQFFAGQNYPIATTTPNGVQVAVPVFLQVGESIRPSGWQNSGANVTLASTGQGQASAMEILWVSK